jgi:hypothetical protein
MKKLGFILMACALIMGTAQCKKNEETNKPENSGESVFITLNVGGGTRAEVIPDDDIAPVYYAEGDMIHVVSDGKYIGTLTYNGSDFTGNITNPTDGQPLHFYFLGNVTPNETLVVGETSTCSVVISDQTTGHPVISYAPSTVNYSEGTTNYTATLLNKCALVKFNVTTVSENATCITGMKNKVTVDFETNEFDYSQEGDGIITLSAGESEKWVILLPQDEMSPTEAHSADGLYTGTCDSISAIAENDYGVNGINVTISHPMGSINGLFTINENGDQVYFSRGNLQYQASTNTWRFAEHQWDYVGDGNTQASPNYDGWIDLYAWGTSGYAHGAVCYQPWSMSTTNSDYYVYGVWNANLYDQTGQADWGYNAISNGGNQENRWRTMTIDEWNYVFFTRSTKSGICFARAVVNGVFGIVVLPDDWDSSAYYLTGCNSIGTNNNDNTISVSDWDEILEPSGVIFLPGAGRISYSEGWVDNAGYICDYWSATYFDEDCAYFIDWYVFGAFVPSTSPRGTGRSVRLVQTVE